MNNKKLPRRILYAIASGILTGWIFHHYSADESTAVEIASYFNLGTDIFLRMIKMIIAPLVFATLVSGITSIGSSASLGRISLRAMIWFVTASIISLSLGIFLVNAFQPGVGMNLSIPPSAVTSVDTAGFNLKALVGHIFPRSIAEAMSNNEILQIVVFSIFFGFGLSHVKKENLNSISNILDELVKVMFKITDYVMLFTPFGVFCAVASVITTQGLGSLVDYGRLIGQFYIGLGILWVLILGVGCYFLGRSVFKLGKLIREPVLLGFSTSSAESAYPKAILALEKFGASKKVTNFVLPLGYTFNLDGSMMYQAFAIVFIAQAYNIDLSFGQQFIILLTLMLTSKGVAGVARASVVVVAAALPMFHLPEAGLLLILAIDQFFDMGRTATNVLGNCVATAVIAKSEDERERVEATQLSASTDTPASLIVQPQQAT